MKIMTVCECAKPSTEQEFTDRFSSKCTADSSHTGDTPGPYLMPETVPTNLHPSSTPQPFPFQFTNQPIIQRDSLRAGRSGDRIPVAARFSAPIQTGPGAHPASCTMGTGSFPGVKAARA